MASGQTKPRTRTEFIRALADAGFGDFLVIKKETADAVLTESRLELLERIREADIESVSHLATTVGRDPDAVGRDIDLLFEHNIIDYRQEGGQTIPELAHETIIVEPLL